MITLFSMNREQILQALQATTSPAESKQAGEFLDGVCTVLLFLVRTNICAILLGFILFTFLKSSCSVHSDHRILPGAAQICGRSVGSGYRSARCCDLPEEHNREVLGGPVFLCVYFNCNLNKKIKCENFIEWQFANNNKAENYELASWLNSITYFQIDDEEETNKEKSFFLADQDKLFIKANLVEAICASSDAAKWVSILGALRKRLRSELEEFIVICDADFRVQLCTALQQIVRQDFPDKWPELIPKLASLLATADGNNWLGGLLTIYKLSKVYE